MKEAETYAADSHGDTLKCSLPSTQTTTTTTRAIKMNAACVCVMTSRATLQHNHKKGSTRNSSN